MVAAAMLLGPCGASAQPATHDAGRFDGGGEVTLVCLKADDGALPFRFEFAAEVKDSVLHGVHGTDGQPGWMMLDGRIGTDGAADLTARGLTGQSAYSLDHTERGVPWEHPVKARFEGGRGDGHWMAPRACEVTFAKVKP